MKKKPAKKSAPKKKAASGTLAGTTNSTDRRWTYVCPECGETKRNLSRSEAEGAANKHHTETGHDATFTHNQ